MGIYNSMNKGSAKANGEYLLMLNAGDVLYNNQVLSKIFDNTNYTQDIIYGDVDREVKVLFLHKAFFQTNLLLDF